MRIWTFVVTVVLGAALTVDTWAQLSEQTTALTNAERSTVRIIALYVDADGALTNVGTGSGIVVSPGRVITNAHVVTQGDATADAIFVIPDRRSGDRGEKAILSSYSSDYDLALLRVDNINAPAIPITDEMPSKNAPVHAFGYPGVTDEILRLPVEQILSPAEPYVTGGSIALFADVAPGGARVPTIFHTAAVNPGNSGGPLSDDCGRLIGVNTWIAGASVSSEGVSVPAGQFIASRSSSLINFLARERVAIEVDSNPCVVIAPADPALEARLGATETALAAERAARLARDKETTKIAEQDRMIAAIVAAVALLGGLGAVLALRVRSARSRRASVTTGDKAEADASGEAPTLPVPRPVRPMTLIVSCFSGAALLTGVLIGATVTKGPDGAAAVRPAAPAAAAATALKCTLLSQPSQASDKDDIPLSFDPGRGCMNGRTAYEMVGGNHMRAALDGKARSLSILQLTGDLKTFTRRSYALDEAAYEKLLKARQAFTEPLCADPGFTGVGADASLSQFRRAAEPYTNGEPVTTAAWTCVKSNPATSATKQ